MIGRECFPDDSLTTRRERYGSALPVPPPECGGHAVPVWERAWGEGCVGVVHLIQRVTHSVG